MTNYWQHLLEEGEYAARRKIVSGLTLEQVTQRPSSASHSIFEEMWHLVAWQHIVVHRDEGRFSKWEAEDFPSQEPDSIAHWDALVEKFFADLEVAYEWSASAERLDREVDPGVTMADLLHSLSVHNAYHFGKIVTLRQILGAWPTPVR